MCIYCDTTGIIIHLAVGEIPEGMYFFEYFPVTKSNEAQKISLFEIYLV